MNLSLVQSLAWIIGSTLFFTGGSYSLIKAHLKKKQEERSDPKYYLSRIIQTGPQKEALNTAYLAELVGLSADSPTSYGQLDPSCASRRLLSSPVIKQAEVKLVAPDTIYIDYTVRQPVAWLYDFENVAVDEEGYPFPITPFFSPKKLPEIYLNIDTFSWNTPLQGEKIELALSILRATNALDFTLKRIDVSKAFAPTLGSREIVVIAEDRGFSRYLRLSLKNYLQELGNYLELCPTLPLKPQVIDLRIPQLGFMYDTDTVDRSPPSRSRSH